MAAVSAAALAQARGSPAACPKWTSSSRRRSRPSPRSRRRSRDLRWRLAAQNLYPKDEGPFTGEISASVAQASAAAAGSSSASERRRHFGRGATRSSPKRSPPRFGRASSHRRGRNARPARGKTRRCVIVRQQVDAFLDILRAVRQPSRSRTNLSGRSAPARRPGRPKRKRSTRPSAPGFNTSATKASPHRTRILYGGSVKPDNAAALLACPNVDGALVGGASLDPGSFSAIARAAAK